MLSYITFLFICSFVINLYDFSMWQPIVAATTISSFLFAFADYFEEFANQYDKQYEIDKQYYETTKKFAEMVFNSAHNHRTDSNGKKYEKVIEKINLICQKSETSYKKSGKLKRDAQINNFIAQLTTYSGFLVFLCILVFYDYLGENFLSVQDNVTVLAFAVIMLTQYLKGWCAERMKKRSAEYEKYSDLWSGLYRSFRSEENDDAD